jgi:hypothetical protein
MRHSDPSIWPETKTTRQKYLYLPLINIIRQEASYNLEISAQTSYFHFGDPAGVLTCGI